MGAAIGDALGQAIGTTVYDFEEEDRQVSANEIQDLARILPTLRYTDDTHMTIGEAEAEQVKETERESDNIYRELNMANNEIHVLHEYRLELTTGVLEYDIPVLTRPVFQELCLKGIVQVKQRQTYSGPHQYD
ncbi:ADP-ribosylglycohydrolase family protein, partial [Chloroflexota bacterium]